MWTANATLTFASHFPPYCDPSHFDDKPSQTLHQKNTSQQETHITQ